MNEPRKWNVNHKGNMEVKMEVDFEMWLFAISEQTSENLNEITIIRFYSLINYIKSKKK